MGAETCQSKLKELAGGIDVEEMDEKLASLVEPGTTIVLHNIAFDLEQTLARTAKRMGYESSALDKILQAPRFCTKNCAYTKSLLFGNRASLGALCAHFEVPYDTTSAHDTRFDTHVLAQCLLEAQRRGVMM